MLYPLFFQPVYKETIWGGQNLKKLFHRELPYQKTAESWEVCCHKNGISIIENGILRGKSIMEAINVYKMDLIGNKGLKFDTFPLLIKYIDANDNLSVQVHPDDEYALKNEGEFGKTEVWYVLSAKENAKIIYGVKNGITKDEFKKNILKNSIEECLNFVSIKKGDVIFIPPGTVHALLEGIVVAEIQQNSDTTYRIYDWNRVDKDGNPRKLHVDKALDVMDFNLNGTIYNPTLSKFKTYSIANISKCKYFNVDKIIVHDKYQDETTGESFYIFMCIEGSGLLHYKGDSYSIPAGKTFMIPAKKEKFSIEGELNLLKVYL